MMLYEVLLQRVPAALKLWLILCLIVGIAAGRAKAALHHIADPDFSSDAGISCVILIFGVVGSASLAACIIYSVWKRRSHLFGMTRLHWLAATPLAWMCGLAIGLLWKYL